nr:hypothetical protein [Novisyntrophococcus fermenticellae]
MVLAKWLICDPEILIADVNWGNSFSCVSSV